MSRASLLSQGRKRISTSRNGIIPRQTTLHKGSRSRSICLAREDVVSCSLMVKRSHFNWWFLEGELRWWWPQGKVFKAYNVRPKWVCTSHFVPPSLKLHLHINGFFAYMENVEENFCTAQIKEIRKSTVISINKKIYKATINLQKMKIKSLYLTYWSDRWQDLNTKSFQCCRNSLKPQCNRYRCVGSLVNGCLM